jgi:cell division septation protein DedD
MAREGGRFEFGWLGILGMFTIFTAGSVVIFFLGVYVGKGLQESRLAREERVVRLPVSPGEGGGESLGDSDLKLYDQLAQAPPAATASIDLAVRSGVEPAATASPAPLATTAPEAAATPPAVAAMAPVPTAPVAVAVRPSPAPDALAKAPPAATVRPVTGKAWSVQVNATKDQATADRIVERLNELGYQAFIVRVRLADETWYRVRVGRFPTMEAATAVVMRLKNEERYSRAFLVNE